MPVQKLAARQRPARIGWRWSRPATPLLSQLLEQFDLDLLDLEEPGVLFAQKVIDLLVQMPDFQLGFQVYFVVILGPRPITRFGAVLAHHDDRRLDRREAR